MKYCALITGASSGIGQELSYLFAKDGYDIILVARSKDKLSDISNDIFAKYKVNVTVIPKDLSLPDSAREIYDLVRGKSLTVGFLINNAGYGGSGSFADSDIKYEHDMMQVNMISLTELTKYFLRDMIQQKHGKILNVASTAGFAPGPFMSIYYASKAFVLSFSEALSNELKGTGVSVTALCPGPTRTGFQKRANVEKTRLLSANVMDASKVAYKGYKALMKGKTIVIPGIVNKLLIQSIRLSPRKLVTGITRWMQSSR